MQDYVKQHLETIKINVQYALAKTKVEDEHRAWFESILKIETDEDLEIAKKQSHKFIHDFHDFDDNGVIAQNVMNVYCIDSQAILYENL